MRCWASFAASAVVALVLAAPATAAPVDQFARATVQLDAAIKAAKPREDAALEQTRHSADGCLSDLRATPEPNREGMLDAYLTSAVAGLANAFGPALRGFQRRIERIHLRREPALMEARRLLRGQLALLDALALNADDICTVFREWQEANWRTPPRSIRIERRLEHAGEALPEPRAAQRRLRRAGHPGAGRILGEPINEDQQFINLGNDPAVCALSSIPCP